LLCMKHPSQRTGLAAGLLYRSRARYLRARMAQGNLHAVRACEVGTDAAPLTSQGGVSILPSKPLYHFLARLTQKRLCVSSIACLRSVSGVPEQRSAPCQCFYYCSSSLRLPHMSGTPRIGVTPRGGHQKRSGTNTMIGSSERDAYFFSFGAPGDKHMPMYRLESQTYMGLI
jgi:hypothetical protein